MTATLPVPTAPTRTRTPRRGRSQTRGLQPVISVSTSQGLSVVSLSEARAMRFEQFAPVRGVESYVGQAHLSGLYCFRGRHVPWRSVLHREVLRIFDFDDAIAEVSVFPFYVHPQPREPGRAPDFLFKLADGGLRVVDVKRAATVETAACQRELAPTREACEVLGWQYRVVSEPDPQVQTNLTWLSLYRRRPADYDVLRPALLDACRAGATLGELLAEAERPALLQPVIFHMLWKRELRIPLDAPIRETSTITTDTGLRDVSRG